MSLATTETATATTTAGTAETTTKFCLEGIETFVETWLDREEKCWEEC